MKRSVFPRIGFAALVSCVSLFTLVPAAHATMVTLNFAGTVYDPVDYSGLGYVPSAIQTGVSYTGTVTFNNAATVRSSDATDAYYSGTDLDMSASVTIDGIYQYILSTPTASDEIDLESNGFDLFKRGPTVYPSFAPNPPFSHVELELQTDTDLLSSLTAADVTIGSFPESGVSDQQTADAGYYFIGATITSVVPEPASISLVGLGALALLLRRRNATPFPHRL